MHPSIHPSSMHQGHPFWRNRRIELVVEAASLPRAPLAKTAPLHRHNTQGNMAMTGSLKYCCETPHPCTHPYKQPYIHACMDAPVHPSTRSSALWVLHRAMGTGPVQPADVEHQIRPSCCFGLRCVVLCYSMAISKRQWQPPTRSLHLHLKPSHDGHRASFAATGRSQLPYNWTG